MFAYPQMSANAHSYPCMGYMMCIVDAATQQPNQAAIPNAPETPYGKTDCAQEKCISQKEVTLFGEQAGVKKTSKLSAALKARLSLPGGDSGARREILERRMRTTQRWRSDNSTFSALNLDSVSSLTGAAGSINKLVRAKPVDRPQSEQKAVGKKTIERQESSATATTAAPDSDGEESDNYCEEDAACKREEQQPQCNNIPEEDEQESAVSAQETAAATLDVDASPAKQEEDRKMGTLIEQDLEASRSLLLAFRTFGGDMPPPELVSLRASAPGVFLPREGAQNASAGLIKSSPQRRSDVKTRTPKFPPANSLPSTSANAYRMQAECRSKSEEIRRTVQSLLNKICPENVATIVDRISKIDVNEVEQLEVIIELIFKKALAEPHYCETYADLVFSLKSVFPEFPSHDGGRPVAFRSSVLNICQNEFEEMMQSGLELDEKEKALEDAEEIELCRKRCKDRMCANMRFIGHLYLRKLLSPKVIGSVICELTCCNNVEQLPEEYAVECACELLLSIGHTLEELPIGAAAVCQVCGRLLEVKSKKTPAGKHVYCKRIQFMIQDLLDTRAAGWAKKMFKSSAKTKGEIRLEQERDLDARSRGKDVLQAELVVAGQRPGCLLTVMGG